MPVDTSPLSAISNMPGPAKVGLAAAGGAGILAVVYLMTNDAKVIAIVAVGMVLVSALVCLWRWFVGWSRKRKAAPLERAILDNTSANPNSISEPARRARLDDLRRSFETGVAKFKDSGKNIYSLPWYLLVGEPGSGKTEAIRHCNVGFPPGLQDQLQGAGGTLNMNWWFTNHAIILDTAGRLMFEEVAPGETSEWREFLQMLQRGRPNCPINGMLLVVPADSLIRDTADSIERKAGKIAQQLDSIQRTLGVRFPVFVVITKSDLINGFREFFDGLTDPQLQHQMLGWTNPNPLDVPFSPDQVEGHLKVVAKQLARRRQGLMLDPVNTEDPNGRRLDQVDALYAFPESILQIAPRLRRYLEMIFVAGEWSPKPLFLRGIYFTSSMREGSALDAELAEALKVPVESLPEGRVWERDRAYFLRDLFVQKVFKEKGLVTRASNTKQLQRRRKLAVMVTAICSIMILLGLTWFGAASLKKHIGDEREHWMATDVNFTDEQDGKLWKVVAHRIKGGLTEKQTVEAQYKGNTKVKLVDGDEVELVKALHAGYERVQKPIQVPWVFKVADFSGGINPKRIDAYRTLYEQSVLIPLADAARAKMKAETAETWNGKATDALAQFVRMEAYAAGGKPTTSNANPSEPAMAVDGLLRYVVDKDADFEAIAKDRKQLQNVFEWLYGANKDQGQRPWPPASLAGKDSPNGETIATGVKTFRAYWDNQIAGNADRLRAIKALHEALREFRAREDEVAALTKAPRGTVKQYEDLVTDWSKAFAAMQASKGTADQMVKQLEDDGAWPDGQALPDIFDAEVRRIIAEAKKQHDMLLTHLPDQHRDAKVFTDQLKNVQKTIVDSRAAIREPQDVIASDALRKLLPEMDRLYLQKGKGIDDRLNRRYVVHFQAYDRANGQVPGAGNSATGTPELATVGNALAAVDRAQEEAATPILALPGRFTTDPERVKQATETSVTLTDFAGRKRRQDLIEVTLKQVPNTPDAIAEKIAAAADQHPSANHGRIPFAASPDFQKAGDFSKSFSPKAAEAFLTGWRAIGENINGKPGVPSKAKVIAPDALRELYAGTENAAKAYAQAYLDYWTKGVADGVRVSIGSWADYFDPGKEVGAFLVMAELIKINNGQRAALDTLQPLVPTDKLKQDYATAARPLEPPQDAIRGAYQDKADKIMGRWRSLRADVEIARETVLSKKPEDFKNDFVAIPYQEADPIWLRYWGDMSMMLLKTLANECEASSQRALKELQDKYTRFPLARPARNVPVLTPQQVAEARNLLNRFSASTLAVARTADATIGEGGQTNVGPIDDQLRRIRGGSELNQAQRTQIAVMKDIAKAIPEPGVPAAARISILEANLRQPRLEAVKKQHADALWTRVRMYRGNEAIGPECDVNQFGAELGTCGYPDQTFQVRMKFNPADNFLAGNAYVFDPDKHATFPPAGNWVVIGLLHTEGAFTDDGKVWHVQIPIDDKLALFVKLELDKKLAGFPQPNRWPEGR